MTRWKRNWKKMCDTEKDQKKKADTSDRVLGLLGLCAKAGRLIPGTQLICDSLRDGKGICLVVMASGAAENTKKRLTDRCTYYGVKLFAVNVTAEKFGHALGKGGELAAVGITDGHFAAGIMKLFK